MYESYPDCQAWLLEKVQSSCEELLEGLEDVTDFVKVLTSAKGKAAMCAGVLAAEFALEDLSRKSPIRSGCVAVGWVNEGCVGRSLAFRPSTEDSSFEAHHFIWSFENAGTGSQSFTLPLVDVGELLPTNLSGRYELEGKGRLSRQNCFFKSLAFVIHPHIPETPGCRTIYNLAVHLRAEFRKWSVPVLIDFPGFFCPEVIQIRHIHHQINASSFLLWSPSRS